MEGSNDCVFGKKTTAHYVFFTFEIFMFLPVFRVRITNWQYCLT
jgi:hypothetical protein